MRIPNQKFIRFRKPIIIAGALGLGIGVYLLLAWQKDLLPFSLINKTYEPGVEVTNMERSEAEKQASKAIDKNPEQKLLNSQTDKPAAPATDSASGKQVVNVMITSAGITNGIINVSGMVTNLVEDGGSCTYVFLKGTQTIVRTATTSTNPTSTTCARLTMPATDLPDTGVWKVSLRYNSTTASGVSTEREITR